MAVSPMCLRTEAPREAADGRSPSRRTERSPESITTIEEEEGVAAREEEGEEEEGTEKDAAVEEKAEIILQEIRRMRKTRGAMKATEAAA